MRRMLVAAAIAQVGGCDYVFRLDHIEAASADARHDADGVTSDAVMPRCSASLDDLFDDGQPCTPWATLTATAGASVDETDLGLVITPSTVMQDSEGGCFGNEGYLFADDGVMVEVDEVLAGVDAYTTLELTANIAIGVTDGMLVMSNNAGTEEYGKLAYVPADMRWWRIRPTSDRSGVEGQFSTDGSTWNQLGITPFVVPESIQLNLQAGSVGMRTASGNAVFRRLIVCR